MLVINTRYVRTAPTGEKTIVYIKNEAELNYHQDLVTEGYKYDVVNVSVVPDSTCISCE